VAPTGSTPLGGKLVGAIGNQVFTIDSGVSGVFTVTHSSPDPNMDLGRPAFGIDDGDLWFPDRRVSGAGPPIGIVRTGGSGTIQSVAGLDGVAISQALGTPTAFIESVATSPLGGRLFAFDDVTDSILEVRNLGPIPSVMIFVPGPLVRQKWGVSSIPDAARVGLLASKADWLFFYTSIPGLQYMLTRTDRCAPGSCHGW
jgi:hypothetical protein